MWAVAIGRSAGNCCQGSGAVAIGRRAGECCQGSDAIAIGTYAGQCCQGCSAIAIGAYTSKNCQQPNAIAIGAHAAETDYDYISLQQDSSVPSNDGLNNTITVTNNYDLGNVRPGMYINDNGYNNVMIMAVNGQVLSLAETPNSGSVSNDGYFTVRARQGTNAIAIGAYAASKTQFPNSIVINATGSDLASVGSGTLVIQSLRQVTGGSIPAGFYQVAWNPTTGEMIAVTP
jgi:hypothetical protein